VAVAVAVAVGRKAANHPSLQLRSLPLKSLQRQHQATPLARKAQKSRKPDFKPKRKGATAASTVSEQAALARLGSGRRLRGKGNNPTARAERVLERGLSGTGRRARKSEATAKRAIDYMASQGTLGKRGKRRKA